MSGRRPIVMAVIVGVAHTVALAINIAAGNWAAAIWVFTASMWFASWFMASRAAEQWKSSYYEAVVLSALGVYRTGSDAS